MDEVDLPLKRKCPCCPASDLSSLCSLTSGYHRWGGEEAVFPNDFHPRRYECVKFCLQIRTGPGPVLSKLLRVPSFSSASRAAAVVPCGSRAVQSFQWTPAHYTRRWSLWGRAPPPSAHALSARVSTKASWRKRSANTFTFQFRGCGKRTRCWTVELSSRLIVNNY